MEGRRGLEGGYGVLIFESRATQVLGLLRGRQRSLGPSVTVSHEPDEEQSY